MKGLNKKFTDKPEKFLRGYVIGEVGRLSTDYRMKPDVYHFDLVPSKGTDPVTVHDPRSRFGQVARHNPVLNRTRRARCFFFRTSVAPNLFTRIPRKETDLEKQRHPMAHTFHACALRSESVPDAPTDRST